MDRFFRFHTLRYILFVLIIFSLAGIFASRYLVKSIDAITPSPVPSVTCIPRPPICDKYEKYPGMTVPEFCRRSIWCPKISPTPNGPSPTCVPFVPITPCPDKDPSHCILPELPPGGFCPPITPRPSCSPLPETCKKNYPDCIATMGLPEGGWCPLTSPTPVACYEQPSCVYDNPPCETPPIPAGIEICPKPICPMKKIGDANCDGNIDLIDYSLWLNSQCNVAGMCGDLTSDFNGDSRVNDDDYEIWLKNRNTLPISPMPVTNSCKDQPDGTICYFGCEVTSCDPVSGVCKECNPSKGLCNRNICQPKIEISISPAIPVTTSVPIPSPTSVPAATRIPTPTPTPSPAQLPEPVERDPVTRDLY